MDKKKIPSNITATKTNPPKEEISVCSSFMVFNSSLFFFKFLLVPDFYILLLLL